MKNEEEKSIKENQERHKIPLPKYQSFNIKEKNKENQNLYYLNSIKNDEKILSSLFFKKYKAIKLIGEGTFSLVYEGINIKDKNKVALKIEQKDEKISLLKEEALTIFKLQGYGIIKFISFGHTKDFNILIEPLLGKSLYNLYLETKKSFTLKDICYISIQCLDRIEHIHSKGYIHGDIKPENFVMGINNPNIIYIIDFGLSKKYRSDRTGNHIQFSITKKMTGTARYASTNSLRGVQISRRDDLESLSYMILYFIMKKLPWQGVKANSLQNRYKKIYYMKKKLCENELFKKLPIEIQNFYKSIKKLKFEEKPNYILLKQYFKDILKSNNFNEYENFSWIKDNSLIDTKFENNLRKRKNNSHKRLMDKLLQNSCNEDKSYEENNLKTLNNYKERNHSNIKNISINNNLIYNSNNKEIKSINEAIIDIDEFSDNYEENTLKNNLEKTQNNIKKYKSYFIKNQNINNIKINNCNMKKNNSNNIFINNKKENNKDDSNKNNIYNYENNKYISFGDKQNNFKEQNENENNLKIMNNKNNIRFKINKNFMINEMRKKNNNKENNDINFNLEYVNNNYNEKNLGFNKRSKSGKEKCLIQ